MTANATARPQLSQPLKWHGGKHYLAGRIVALMPPHAKYLEACGGGLSVLLHKDCEGVAEWVNDTHAELTNFWQVLRDPTNFEYFKRAVECTPLSEIEFEIAKTTTQNYAGAVDRAWAFFIRARQSRQGLSRDYCTPTSRTRRGMNEQVSAWLTAVDGLQDVHERLRRVEVWNRPAIEAIERLDSQDFFTYVDPPYIWSTRNSKGEYGDHEMDNRQHLHLLMCLERLKGKFMLSGYHHELYDNFARARGWRCVEFELPNNASSAKTKQRKTECLWMNY